MGGDIPNIPDVNTIHYRERDLYKIREKKYKKKIKRLRKKIKKLKKKNKRLKTLVKEEDVYDGSMLDIIHEINKII